MTEPLTPVSMLPAWPEVRCDGCHKTYTHPDADHGGLIVGKCPHCGFGTFSTTMKATA